MLAAYDLSRPASAPCLLKRCLTFYPEIAAKQSDPERGSSGPEPDYTKNGEYLAH